MLDVLSVNSKRCGIVAKLSLYSTVANTVKRYFIVLFVILLLSLMCFMLTSSDVTYTSLTEAYLNSLSNESGIAVLPEGNYRLDENITTNVSFSISGEVEIDLNGKDITFTSSILPAIEISGGILTISDINWGGKLSSNRECVYINSGEMILESGTIAANSTASCIIISEQSVMTMNGGTVMSIVAPAIINYGVLNKSDGFVLSGSSEEDAIENDGSFNDSSPQRGEINIELEATYPTVNYSVTLPVIDSLSLQRTEDTNLSEKEFEVAINDVENLFDERYISVSFETDGVMSDAEGNILPFDFEIDGRAPDESGEITILINESGIIEPFNGRVIIDTKNIPARGTYSAEIVYSIAVVEASEE